MSMLEKREDVRGRALLVGLCCDSMTDFDNSDEATMAELEELLSTAGGETVLTSRGVALTTLLSVATIPLVSMLCGM